MKLSYQNILSLLIALPSALAAINGKCSSGNGVCVTTSSCTAAGGTYVSGLCPNDASNVKCCTKPKCTTSNGLVGSCMFASKCTGTSYSGACPGGSDYKCCVQNKSCTTSNGLTGTCKSSSSCTGTTYSGLCPGDSSIKCCVQNTSCTTGSGLKGTCMNSSSCTGTTYSGLCPGDASIKCCVPKTSTNPPSNSNQSNNNNNNNSGNSSNSCRTSVGITGTCMNSSNCTGNSVSGLCPGASNIKCCIPKKSGSSCPTKSNDVPLYKSTKIEEALGLILGNEGRCQNDSGDTGNKFDGRIGYTCMGVTPREGFSVDSNNVRFFEYARSSCSYYESNNRELFVKCAYDLNKDKFREATGNLYREKYSKVAGCESLPQPAYTVCVDFAVNFGPAWQTGKYASSLGNKSSKDYCYEICSLARTRYKNIVAANPSQQKFLNGWLNRCTVNESVCRDYC